MNNFKKNKRLGAYSGAERREPEALDFLSRDRLDGETAYGRARCRRTHARTYARYPGNARC